MLLTRNDIIIFFCTQFWVHLTPTHTRQRTTWYCALRCASSWIHCQVNAIMCWMYWFDSIKLVLLLRKRKIHALKSFFVCLHIEYWFFSQKFAEIPRTMATTFFYENCSNCAFWYQLQHKLSNYQSILGQYIKRTTLRLFVFEHAINFFPSN